MNKMQGATATSTTDIIYTHLCTHAFRGAHLARSKRAFHPGLQQAEPRNVNRTYTQVGVLHTTTQKKQSKKYHKRVRFFFIYRSTLPSHKRCAGGVEYCTSAPQNLTKHGHIQDDRKRHTSTRHTTSAVMSKKRRCNNKRSTPPSKQNRTEQRTPGYRCPLHYQPP